MGMISYAWRKAIMAMLAGVAFAAWMVELWLGMMGDFDDMVSHVPPPGTVAIRPFARNAHDIYVVPWVAHLHHILLWSMVVSLIGLIGIGAYNLGNGDTE